MLTVATLHCDGQHRTTGGAAETDAAAETQRDHNPCRLDVLARTGLVGLGLWVALWLAWYWRLVTGCRRLLYLGLGVRRRVAVLCMMLTTAILVSVLLAPELEGAQVAAPAEDDVRDRRRDDRARRDDRRQGQARAADPVSPGADPQPQREIGRRPADPDRERA